MFQDNEQDEYRAYSFSGETSGTGDPPADPADDGGGGTAQQGDPPADPADSSSTDRGITGGDPPADPA